MAYFPRTVLVSDSPVTRVGIRQLAKLIIVAEASTGEEGLSLAVTLQPDIVALDIHLSRVQPCKFLAELRQREVSCEFFIVSWSRHAGWWHRFPSTCRGSAAEDNAAEDNAAEDNAAEDNAAEDNAAEDNAVYGRLSQQELAVLDLLVKGLLVKEVAAALGLSEHTVKEYKRRICKKLGTPRTVDAIRWILKQINP